MNKNPETKTILVCSNTNESQEIIMSKKARLEKETVLYF